MPDIIRIEEHNLSLLENVADVFDEAVRADRALALARSDLHLLFVAVDAGTVVGQVLGVVHLHVDKCAEIYIEDLGVDPAHQRRGIATELVQALREASRGHGCEELWVATEPENEAANAFYASLGLPVRVAHVFEGVR